MDAFDGLLVQEVIADADAAARAAESDHALEKNARRMARHGYYSNCTLLQYGSFRRLFFIDCEN